MSVKAVLFDLDGTLLPMDQEKFVKDYFGRLAAFLAPHGYEPKTLIDTVWQGTAAMVKNDGSLTNEGRFWQVFNSRLGDGGEERAALFDAFYAEEFDKVSASCGYDGEAPRLTRELRSRGYRLILATNPIFPAAATYRRIRWAGLNPDDFELITTYENSRYTKPNLDYYREILASAGLSAEECIMVGNDVGEDMVAERLGMRTYLVTRDLINRAGEDISRYSRGSLLDILPLFDASESE